MASKDINDYTGRLRNLVFYRWKNKKCIRTIPPQVKQTEATKKMAGLFGKASKIGKFLRLSLGDMLPDPKDTRMRLKFCNAIFKWLRYYQPGDESANQLLNGFSFTENIIPLQLLRKIHVEWLDGKVRISMDALNLPDDLPAPRNTKTVELKFGLVGCEIEKMMPPQAKSKRIEFNYESSIIEDTFIVFDIAKEKGILFIIVLSAKYKVMKESDISDVPRWYSVGFVDCCFRN